MSTLPRILSLGGGVQSATLYLMAHEGELPPFDHVIFADTQSEPLYVYEYLEYLLGLGGTPITRVTAGNLGEDFLSMLRGEKRGASPPLFVRNDDGPTPDKGGMLWRQCTKEYKIEPINRYIKQTILGIPRGGAGSDNPTG
jgi:3'-phosphoadenosine 5'-phosphosulfate sulfotransferase (PAPS reductase)/FAD synthetase